MKRIGIIGGGSWATALVKILQESNDSLFWWVRSEEQLQYIIKHKKNPNYLRAVELNLTKLTITNNINELIVNSEVLIIATPSAFIHDTFINITPEQLNNKLIISAVKGIVPQSNQVPSLYFSERFNKSLENIGIISGPCHAEEVAMERLSYLTVACTDLSKANLLSESLNSRYIVSNSSDDMHGVELSSVLKNVYAIAAGICSGLGYGDNFLAVLISSSIRELENIVNIINPISRNINSTVYLGDLLVTAYSQHSRNRRFGMMIGKGYSVKATQMEMKMIAEGYYASKCIYTLNQQHGIDAPIAQAVYHILYDKIAPKIEIKILSGLIC